MDVEVKALCTLVSSEEMALLLTEEDVDDEDEEGMEVVRPAELVCISHVKRAHANQINCRTGSRQRHDEGNTTPFGGWSGGRVGLHAIRDLMETNKQGRRVKGGY